MLYLPKKTSTVDSNRIAIWTHAYLGVYGVIFGNSTVPLNQSQKFRKTTKMQLEPTEYCYFIGIGLPPNEDRFFSALKATYSRLDEISSPPHITIKPPFFHRNESYIREKLTACCSTIDSFEVKISLVGSFAHKRNSTVFLAPQKTAELKRLERRISDTFSFLPPEPDYHPHLTIGQRIPHAEVSQVKAQLRFQEISLQLLVTSVTSYRRKKSETWSPVVSCPLKMEDSAY